MRFPKMYIFGAPIESEGPGLAWPGGQIGQKLFIGHNITFQLYGTIGSIHIYFTESHFYSMLTINWQIYH